MTAEPRNLAGGGWLLADMALALMALSIVKALGLEYPPVQLVCLRASVGLVLLLPWIVARRSAFRGVGGYRLHALRVVLSTIALTASFFAIARVPLALFTAVNFTRPLVLMAMAALILGERIGTRRWFAAGVGFSGVIVAANPEGRAWGWGAIALVTAVIAGSGAVVLTRRLAASPPVVLMTFYTTGLALLTLPFAWVAWVPVAPWQWPALIAIGVFSQMAQLCFLNAHRLAETGFLAVLGYFSLVLSTLVGFFVFSEVPQFAFWIGAAMIVAAGLIASGSLRRRVLQTDRAEPGLAHSGRRAPGPRA